MTKVIRDQALRILFLVLVSICVSDWVMDNVCQAEAPLRVAILPVLDDTRMADKETVRVIDKALAAKFHMPIENIIRFYDIVPAAEVSAALPQPIKRAGLKPDRAMLAQVADRVGADVVIGVEITSYLARTYTSGWDDDLIQETDISLRLVGYNAADGKFLELRDHEYYQGDWSVKGDAEYLTKKMMDRFMEKVPYTYKQKQVQ